MWTRLEEKEGATDAWGWTVSDTHRGEGNGTGVVAAGPAYGMGREEIGPRKRKTGAGPLRRRGNQAGR